MAKNALLDKILKGSSACKYAAVLSESEFFKSTFEPVPTGIPMMNVAMSGKWDGGITPGITVMAGPSRHFKTNICLKAMSAYMNKYPDAVGIVIDSEFGFSESYLKMSDIDPERVVHAPVTNIEEAKFLIVQQLESIERGDHVFVLFDSMGNIASMKEVQDAIDQKSVADMTRAKAVKSFFRIVTPKINMLQIPLFVVAHTYDTMDLFPKKVVSGGTGITYSADTVFIIGRSQQKEGNEIAGYQFNFIVDKSRFVKEKSRFELIVTYDEGIDPYSGLFDPACELGYIESPSKGWYTRKCVDGDKKWRRAEMNCEEFWKPIMDDPAFQKAYESKYALLHS